MLEALRALEPAARACWLYDLDAVRARAPVAVFADANALVAYALKANALPALLEALAAEGLGADAVSLGELALAAAAGFDASRRVLNGNGRTPEEAAWVAREGVHSVNADGIGELDVLERAAAAAGARVRVALRVNPNVDAPTHRHIATGDDEAKFGVDAADALAALAARARWPHLALEGLHVHVGSQLLDTAPLEAALAFALDVAAESARRGAPIAFVNAGGGFGIDYEGRGREFPVERWAARLAAAARERRIAFVVEPGRWLVGPNGWLLAEVLSVKVRDGRRFVTLAAGMNDLIRPALYGARHRMALAREGAPARFVADLPDASPPASVVGPVCESADVFAADVALPEIAAGDCVAIADAGAYGASMSSNYNARGRLAELVWLEGRLVRARAGETARDLVLRRASDPLALPDSPPGSGA